MLRTLAIIALLLQGMILNVADTPTKARTDKGAHISWREHLIDDQQLGGLPLRGADGLQMADFDKDGFADIVSVHEDSSHIRLAFGSEKPDRWRLVTLAEGDEAAAAEDAAVGDVNGDGYPDILVACELAHLIYFQNPGRDAASAKWPRAILENTRNRGSFIRVFLADLDKDGRLEAIAANKGEQLPTNTPGEGLPENERLKLPVSWFSIPNNPLETRGWIEHELIRFMIPINCEPVDIDADGDLDIVAASRGEARLVLMEQVSSRPLRFEPRPIEVEGIAPGERRPWGFMIAFHDLNRDQRLDMVMAGAQNSVIWLEQPARLSEKWNQRRIGHIHPDSPTAMTVADINSDGYADVVTGGCSQNPRDYDGPNIHAESVVGRIAWFENAGPKGGAWLRHDISRTKRGMYDAFIPRDLDGDGDLDLVGTRGNSGNFDGVFWLEQVRSAEPRKAFTPARSSESMHLPLPAADRAR